MPLLACSKRSDGHSASFGYSGSKNEVDLILSQAAMFSPPVNIYSMSLTSCKACFGVDQNV